MKHLKLFEDYNNSDIHQWLKAHEVENYTIQKDGVHINGSLDLRYIWTGEIPFKISYADCILADHAHLTTLKNMPEKIWEDYSGLVGTSVGDSKGYYWIQDNELTSLEGCPRKVKRFIASGNKLTSLIGAPEYVYDACYLYDNQLESMEGCPKHIGLRLDFWNNPIKSLIGIPPRFMVECDGSNIKDGKSILNYEIKDGVYTFKIDYRILDAYWDNVLKDEPEYFNHLVKREPDIDGNFNNSTVISSKLYNKYKYLFRGGKSGLLNIK